MKYLKMSHLSQRIEWAWSESNIFHKADERDFKEALLNRIVQKISMLCLAEINELL